ncbi:dipeptidase [Caulobacter sp. 17J80-11]|uniref:dipeptidase n=1 Tax=Caulobacter sp. 17J80-11 TaxID=2763502 RepID=UPI001653D2A7|nr:membrane dipeptidase [Caulobacter sp. 17J80-11]MBC6983288.1 membrane dipeptidase [Caulobacter sp. 17J80-11]
MIDRRRVVGAAGLVAMGGAAGGRAWAAEGPARWPRMRQAMAIDAMTGVDLFYVPEDDPAAPQLLQHLRECGLTGAVMTAAPQGRFWLNDKAYQDTRARIDEWKGRIDKHPDVLLLVRERADLERARRENKVGVIFTFQGTEPLGEDLDRIASFREQGVRMIQLTHNRRNLVGDGALEPGDAGLSNYGHQVVERLNAERIVVDLSHGSPRTIREGILASKAPVLVGHSGCRALADASRLTSDANLRLLADRGGVVGIIFWPYLRVQGQQTSADVIRHLEHAVRICGEDHVGIGTDLGISPIELTPEFAQDNLETIRDMIGQGIFARDRSPEMTLFPPDLNVPNRFETLAARLSARGWPDARIEKILGANFARVMGEVWG